MGEPHPGARDRERAADRRRPVASVGEPGNRIVGVAHRMPPAVREHPFDGTVALDAVPHAVRATPAVGALAAGVGAVDPCPTRSMDLADGGGADRARAFVDDFAGDQHVVRRERGHGASMHEGCHGDDRPPRRGVPDGCRDGRRTHVRHEVVPHVGDPPEGDVCRSFRIVSGWVVVGVVSNRLGVGGGGCRRESSRCASRDGPGRPPAPVNRAPPAHDARDDSRRSVRFRSPRRFESHPSAAARETIRDDGHEDRARDDSKGSRTDPPRRGHVARSGRGGGAAAQKAIRLGS